MRVLSPARVVAHHCSLGCILPRLTRQHAYKHAVLSANYFGSKQLQPKNPKDDEWDTDWRERRDVDENVYYENIATGQRTVTHTVTASELDAPIWQTQPFGAYRPQSRPSS